MRCDLRNYVFTSLVLFFVAFTISLRSFIDSDLRFSVDECIRLEPFGHGRHLVCSSHVSAFFSYVEMQKLSLLIHLNMAVCCFVLLGKFVIGIFFGRLSPTESQHFYDRMLNFLLFKVIFVGAIMEPVWIQIVRLSFWIAALGLLRIFSLLSRDRFDQLTTMPYMPIADYVKISILLICILVCNLTWYIASFILFPAYTTFLTLEFLPVFLDTLQVLTKYWGQILDQQEQSFERKRMVNYYTELGTDMLVLGLTLLQYLQLIWMHGISFSLVDIVLFLNVRSVLRNLYKKALSHRDRWRAMSYVRKRYVDATPIELSQRNDDCAICREKMKTAKKLACGHLFHVHCLHSWIQHHVSKPTCPTCRRPLTPSPQGVEDSSAANARDNLAS
ncbi:hypothetical protein VTP01DRAFT_8590 [Rhizomucor pusillus]|uniref:uncharacterized protein n=1 Tax=Rhizomucor pusillus TaxID=4840 RepID=UPI00374230CC